MENPKILRPKGVSKGEAVSTSEARPKPLGRVYSEARLLNNFSLKTTIEIRINP